jgi:hypothetical protein
MPETNDKTGRQPPPRRFPGPWCIEPTEGGYCIRDANGIRICRIYGNDEFRRAALGYDSLTWDEARILATWIARLPDLAKPR